MTTYRFNPLPGRRCGDCKLCCTLVPVKELHKPANTKCQHVFSGGCRIYAKRPIECRVWNCAWLTDPATLHLRRPNKVHYVIDSVPDYIRAVDNTNGNEVGTYKVLQIWVDPKYPDAHEDPALRKMLNDHKEIALIRFGNERAIVLCPPSRPESSGKWLEVKSALRIPEELTWAKGS